MSNGKQETISDIVAEMRRDCPARHMDGTRYRDGDFVYTNGTVEKLADRIEAAAKREKEMSDTYFCGYDPEEALVAQCSTCRFFKKKHSHCTLNDSTTNARYKCSGWKFKTNKECVDEYNASHNHEVAELRKENARLMQRLEMCQKVNEQQEKEYIALKSENDHLRAALKPVMECKVMSAMTAEIEPGRSDYCANIIEKAQRIYNEGGESEVE